MTGKFAASFDDKNTAIEKFLLFNVNKRMLCSKVWKTKMLENSCMLKI